MPSEFKKLGFQAESNENLLVLFEMFIKTNEKYCFDELVKEILRRMK